MEKLLAIVRIATGIAGICYFGGVNWALTIGWAVVAFTGLVGLRREDPDMQQPSLNFGDVHGVAVFALIVDIIGAENILFGVLVAWSAKAMGVLS